MGLGVLGGFGCGCFWGILTLLGTLGRLGSRCVEILVGFGVVWGLGV